jgi:hypothetical protein
MKKILLHQFVCMIVLATGLVGPLRSCAIDGRVLPGTSVCLGSGPHKSRRVRRSRRRHHDLHDGRHRLGRFNWSDQSHGRSCRQPDRRTGVCDQ